jgi:hypothetical protein
VWEPQPGARRHPAGFAGAVAAGWLTVGGCEEPLSATRSMMIAPAASSASSTTTLSVAASAAELRELLGGCAGGHCGGGNCESGMVTGRPSGAPCPPGCGASSPLPWIPGGGGPPCRALAGGGAKRPGSAVVGGSCVWLRSVVGASSGSDGPRAGACSRSWLAVAGSTRAPQALQKLPDPGSDPHCGHARPSRLEALSSTSARSPTLPPAASPGASRTRLKGPRCRSRLRCGCRTRRRSRFRACWGPGCMPGATIRGHPGT